MNRDTDEPPTKHSSQKWTEPIAFGMLLLIAVLCMTLHQVDRTKRIIPTGTAVQNNIMRIHAHEETFRLHKDMFPNGWPTIKEGKPYTIDYKQTLLYGNKVQAIKEEPSE